MPSSVVRNEGNSLLLVSPRRMAAFGIALRLGERPKLGREAVIRRVSVRRVSSSPYGPRPSQSARVFRTTDHRVAVVSSARPSWCLPWPIRRAYRAGRSVSSCLRPCCHEGAGRGRSPPPAFIDNLHIPFDFPVEPSIGAASEALPIGAYCPERDARFGASGGGSGIGPTATTGEHL